MKRLALVLALSGVACGGEPPARQPAEAPAAAPQLQQPVTAPQAGVGGLRQTSWEVSMEAARGKYYFSPATLTIRVGDVVRFRNVSGGPHNIQFKKDRIPANAVEVLNAAMAEKVDELTGPFITTPNGMYEVSFANAPPGSYFFVCQPHQILGMTGMITVIP